MGFSDITAIFQLLTLIIEPILIVYLIVTLIKVNKIVKAYHNKENEKKIKADVSASMDALAKANKENIMKTLNLKE